MKELGERLGKRARQLGLSYAQAGIRAGVGDRSFQAYVKGTRTPTLEHLMRMCEFLQLSPNDLLLDGKTIEMGKRETLMAQLEKELSLLETDGVDAVVEIISAFSNHWRRKQERR